MGNHHFVSQFLHEHQPLGPLKHEWVCGWCCQSSSISPAGIAGGSRHARGAAAVVFGQAPATAMTQPLAHSPRIYCTRLWPHSPLAAVGARRVAAAGTSPYACFAFSIWGLRNCWGEAQVTWGSLRVASQRAWASLRTGKGNPGGASPLKLGSWMECHSSILGTLGQGQTRSVCGSAGGGCKLLSVFATRWVDVLVDCWATIFQLAESTIKKKKCCASIFPHCRVSLFSCWVSIPSIAWATGPSVSRQGASKGADKPPVMVQSSGEHLHGLWGACSSIYVYTQARICPTLKHPEVRSPLPSVCSPLPAVLPAGMGHSIGGMWPAQKHHPEASGAMWLPTDEPWALRAGVHHIGSPGRPSGRRAKRKHQ